MTDRIQTLIESFKGKQILVIGDVMLDSYVEGDTTRINPEAPVPVVAVTRKGNAAGGAANVAANIVSLGAQADLFGFCGDDEPGRVLKEIITSQGINPVLDICDKTIEKTRIMSRGQQIVRFDSENVNDKFFSQGVLERLVEKAQAADCIVISDYAKGTITHTLMETLQEFRSKVVIDPKPVHRDLYKGMFLVKPNEKELFAMSSEKTVAEAGTALRQAIGSHLVVTLGADGMMLFSDSTTTIPTYAREVYDVTGAGDSALAGIALGFAAGGELEEAAIIGNHAAGISVEKHGAYAVTLKELKERIQHEEDTIVDYAFLQELVKRARQKGKKIVWTNGCFDLLHIGHVRYLKKAKQQGDMLIVGLNSDESVRSLKGPSRPIQTEQDRAELLASLSFIDYVFIFGEQNVSRYLRELQPDIFAKGADYTKETMNQEEVTAVASYGGEITFIDLERGKSTSEIIKKITLHHEEA